MSEVVQFLVGLAVIVAGVLAYVVLIRVADVLADRRRRRTTERIVQEEHQRATAAQVFKEHGPGGAS